MEQFGTGNTKYNIEMFPGGEATIVVEFGKCIHPDSQRKVKPLPIIWRIILSPE
ncbi:MAG: hypothetical protein ABFC84_01875 [Veillonellales bacterium]